MRWTSSEEQEQRSLIQWRNLVAGSIPELRLLFHPTNEGKREPRTWARLVSLGASPGLPDLILPVARGAYIGLAIEFKRPDGKGRIRPEQDAWLRALREEKWATLVATQWERAANAITLYLRGEWKEEAERRAS